jgi:hypothetical protein
MAAVLPPRGITGTVPSNPAVEHKPLNVNRSPYFTFQWNYARWQVVEDPDEEDAFVFLPLLGTIKHEPGLGGVDKNGDTSLAVAGRMKNGWASIDPRHCLSGDTPDGQPGYVRTWPARGGRVHGTAWQTPRMIGNRVKWHNDTDGYYRWLKRLMVDGVVPAPDPAVMENLIDIAEQRQKRSAGRALSNPYAANLLAEADARLEAIRNATVPGQEAEAAPKPKPRRRAAKAKPQELADV